MKRHAALHQDTGTTGPSTDLQSAPTNACNSDRQHKLGQSDPTQGSDAAPTDMWGQAIAASSFDEAMLSKPPKDWDETAVQAAVDQDTGGLAAKVAKALVSAGSFGWAIVTWSWPAATIVRLIASLSEGVLSRLISSLSSKARARLLALVDQAWPVGLGFGVTGQVGATFGLPLRLEVAGKEEILRAKTLRMDLTRVGQLWGGVDTGAGAGAQVTFGKIKLGARATAELEAGGFVNVTEDYAFPLDKLQSLTALLIKAAALDLQSGSRVAVMMARHLGGVDADAYRTKLTVEVGVGGGAAAGARLGLGVDKDGKKNQKVDTEEVGRWKYLPDISAGLGLGGDGAGSITLHRELSDGRIPLSLAVGVAAYASWFAKAKVRVPGLPERWQDKLKLPAGLAANPTLAGSVEVSLTYDPAKTSFSFVGLSLKVGTIDQDPLDEEQAKGGEVELLWGADAQEVADGKTPSGVGLLPRSLRMRRVVGLQQGIGGAWAKQNAALLRTMLPEKGSALDTAMLTDATLDVGLTLGRPQLQALLDVARKAVAAFDADTAIADLVTMGATGRLPAWLPARDLGRVVLGSMVHKAEARILGGFALGGQLQAAAGPKLKLDGRASGYAFYKLDLLERGQGAWLKKQLGRDVTGWLQDGDSSG